MRKIGISLVLLAAFGTAQAEDLAAVELRVRSQKIRATYDTCMASNGGMDQRCRQYISFLGDKDKEASIILLGALKSELIDQDQLAKENAVCIMTIDYQKYVDCLAPLAARVKDALQGKSLVKK